MRKLVHLSDLHFGRINPAILQPLIALVTQCQPDLVAISGDLTQRARREEFKAARAFLDVLPSPQIIVPGNHDVPWHNLYRRFRRPLSEYCRYITRDLAPFYQDEEVAVLGINTARSFTIKQGRINKKQIDLIQKRLCHLSPNIIKIIATHHPFDLPARYNQNDLVGRARAAMEVLARCGADLFLAGHYHLSHTGHTAERYKIAGHSALTVQAGTATSTRGRGEANSFNIIQIDRPYIIVERFMWRAATASFVVSAAERFQHTPGGWLRVA